MASELIIPVYLNQRLVFDLLAMREGGIAHVTKVVASEDSKETDQRRYGAEFGLAKALSSLLSISVSGDRDKGAESGSSKSSDEDRVHTPASLLYRLRNQLLEDGTLTQLYSNSPPQMHKLVEFDAELKRNPIIETIDAFSSIMEMGIAFEDDKPSGKGGKGSFRKKSENEKILSQVNSFSDKLRAGNTVDVVAENLGNNKRALITLETEYLNDPTMADLVDGSFKVIGKVIQIVDENSSISLLRKTALSKMSTTMLKQMFDGFEKLSDNEQFNLPSIDQHLEGPAFQILPIAIFA